MANSEQVTRLFNTIASEGSPAWNKWRQQHPEIRIDLNGAEIIGAVSANLHHIDLSGADLANATFDLANLSDANLSRANLVDAVLNQAFLNRANFKDATMWRTNLMASDFEDAVLEGANLSCAKLTNAKLINADLKDADLSGADLSGASLTSANLAHALASGANFSNAKLNHANLRKARLIGTNFFGADLADADVSEAEMGFTVFANNDLSRVIGLESVRHFEASSLGTDTIYRSKGDIPEVFLRGAGVPDSLVTYISSLNTRALQVYSCFISYSSKDQEFAERLYADLQRQGVRCWFAPEDLKIGDRIRVGLDESIRRHDKLLLVLSESSISSEWVEQEVEAALSKEDEQGRTVLFPIRLDDTLTHIKTGWPALIFRTRFIGDFRDWRKHDSYQKAFSRLIRDLTLDVAAESKRSEQRR